MDDRDAFERQVAGEMARRAGPVQPVDDAAIYAAITSAVPSPRRRFHSWFHSTDARTVPVPATNGHTPTVRGRTPLMFSPAKVIAVAALVFGVGGLLAAQPRGPDSASAPASSPSPENGLPGVSPAASQSEAPLESQAPLDPMGASYWTGTFTYSPDTSTVEASDPRISGDWVQVDNPASYSDRAGPGGSFGVSTSSVRIENADGAWAGTFTGIYKGDSRARMERVGGRGGLRGPDSGVPLDVARLHPGGGHPAGCLPRAHLTPSRPSPSRDGT